jgi:DNA-directed RNA polymerase specialized sigma24 family protein
MSRGEVMINKNELEDLGDSLYSSIKRSTFVDVDRKQENKDIVEYQKTGDRELFEKIYKIRVPTLQNWARKYRYLMDSQEDLFSEFNICFTRAVATYKKGKGSFNTWLFSLLQNYVRNLQTSRRAKKRLPKGMNPDAICKFIFSLDYYYGKDDDSENTLKDVLANKYNSEDKAINNIIYEETVSKMSNNNPVVKGFLHKLSFGNTVTSLLKQYRTKTGNINIDKDIFKDIDSASEKDIVSEIIRKNNDNDSDFMIVDYDISHKDSHNNLKYTIEMKKTKETDMVIKALRRIKRDRESLISKMS